MKIRRPRTLSNSLCQGKRFCRSSNCWTTFHPRITRKIEAKGVKLVYLTLHVGLGTFRPVSVDNVDEHEMHSEFYNLSAEVLKPSIRSKVAVVVSSQSARHPSAPSKPSVINLMAIWKLILVGQISSSNLATPSESLMPSQPISTYQNLLWLC